MNEVKRGEKEIAICERDSARFPRRARRLERDFYFCSLVVMMRSTVVCTVEGVSRAHAVSLIRGRMMRKEFRAVHAI